MDERKANCQRQSGMDCRRCDVAVDIARNVLSKPKESVVASIEEISLKRCPEGTKFLLNGELRELIGGVEKVIQLRIVDGESNTNQGISQTAAAAV